MKTPGAWLKRTIYLDERQVETLRELAHVQDTTISDLVRQALDLHLIGSLTHDQLCARLAEPEPCEE